MQRVLQQISQNLNLDLAKDEPLYTSDEIKRIEVACKANAVSLNPNVLESYYNKVDIMAFVNGYECCKACKSANDCQSSVKGFSPIIDEQGRLSYYRCALHERQQAVFAHEQNKANAAIPRLYRKMTFESLEDTGNTNTIKLAKSIASGNEAEKGLFLFGEPGCGKTHIAIATLQEWLNHKSGLFYTMPQLAGHMRSLVKDDVNLAELMTKLKNTELLVIDDLGAEKWSEFLGQQMFELLNERNANERLTIITSNLTLDELVGHMESQGARLASRIAGMCEIRKVVGQDRRLF